MEIIEKNAEYQNDSLFSLIGSNSLPNYFAFLLLKKSSCHVYYVHTNETNQVADRLANVLDLPYGSWTKILVDGYLPELSAYLQEWFNAEN